MATPTIKLVSFENSNSWLKRHDASGTTVIQAGYRENPGRNAHCDNENPIIAFRGQNARWYGSMPCGGTHRTIFGQSKIETARACFAACLQPSDHGKKLQVVASHWNSGEFDALKTALLGQYVVTRNGELIETTVTEVVTTMEGLGAYHAVSNRLQVGGALLLELGFGTAEVFRFDAKGCAIDAAVVDALGVATLIDKIADDPAVRAALLADASGTANRSLISASLSEPVLGRIGADQWSAIRGKYTKEFVSAIGSHLRTHYAPDMQGVTNLVLTGGGAALIQAVLPELAAKKFTIPENPQTASVRGAYARMAAKAVAK
jgi:hypothetical protein